MLHLSSSFLLVLLTLTFLSFFFFNDTATTEIYTLSLHDALPICTCGASEFQVGPCEKPSNGVVPLTPVPGTVALDRKSTRLNSSHSSISYAVFCLKKKKKLIQYALPHDRSPHYSAYHSYHLISGL